MKKARQAVSSPIVDGRGVCQFDAARGSYAIVAIHDENANGKLDKNVLGVPKEGYGASGMHAEPSAPSTTTRASTYRGGRPDDADHPQVRPWRSHNSCSVRRRWHVQHA